MTPTLLVVLLSQAEVPDNPPAGALEPPEPTSPAEKWHYLARLEATELAMLPQVTPVALWVVVLLTLALLSTGCASLTPPPDQGTSLRQ